MASATGAVYVNRNFMRTVLKTCDRAFLYIGGAIKRQARDSLRIASKKNPHSLPGEPVKTHKPAKVYKNTIGIDYSRFTKILRVGPLKIFKVDARHLTRPAAIVGPLGGPSTVPKLLEYGGTMIGLKPQWFRSADVPVRFRVRMKTNRRKNTKWVVIRPGRYVVKARPTMRLAFNKTMIQTNVTLVRAFRNAGITDPVSLIKVI